MKPRRSPIALLLALVLLTLGGRARADIPPPNACAGGAGSPCRNAGPSQDQPGVCVATTCARWSPGPNGTRYENPCVLCQLKDTTPTPPAASASASPNASANAAPNAGPPAPVVPPAGCRGCEVGSGPSSRALGLGGAGLVVALAVLARRRRR